MHVIKIVIFYQTLFFSWIKKKTKTKKKSVFYFPVVHADSASWPETEKAVRDNFFQLIASCKRFEFPLYKIYCRADNAINQLAHAYEAAHILRYEALGKFRENSRGKTCSRPKLELLLRSFCAVPKLLASFISQFMHAEAWSNCLVK